MAKKVQKSGGLFAKLGAAAKKAFDAHKGDETDFGGGGSLPGGINGGIAQLTKCEFGQYGNDVKTKELRGQYYFMAMGTVVSPDKHEGRRVKGLTTKIGPEPLCETEGRSRESVEDHLSWVLNELRKLGVDTEGLELEDLETTVAALQEEAPYFEFSTWETEATDKYDARVWEKWRGIVDYNPSEDEDEEEVSEDEEEEEEEKPVKKAKAKKKAPEPEEEEEEEEEEWTPSKGDVVNFKPMDPKTKKPSKKYVECEVILVNKKTGELTLKNMTDGKTKYTEVDPSDVVQVED